jgi:formylglycine-generating enzyme required for sulfatase activity
VSALDEAIEALYREHGPAGDRAAALVLADRAIELGDDRLCAAALDRAFGLDPTDASVARARAEVLDRLQLVEHGITFRYVPVGTCVIGSRSGEPDERPVHPVRLGGYWLSRTPVSWARYCALLGWSEAPGGAPPEHAIEDRERLFALAQENKIRMQYCEGRSTAARDWHSHAGMGEMFGEVPTDGGRPAGYDHKPMVAVSWQSAEELARRLTQDAQQKLTFRLPTEEEWEKGARGGRIGARWAWGDEAPTRERCDFDHFGEFWIRPFETLPPNGYGLIGCSGTVWEWTSTPYDALAYRGERASAGRRSAGPQRSGGGDDQERVLRGGSWADCAEACTVSFRASRASRYWRRETWGDHVSPNIGFRLCRVEV